MQHENLLTLVAGVCEAMHTSGHVYSQSTLDTEIVPLGDVTGVVRAQNRGIFSVRGQFEMSAE